MSNLSIPLRPWARMSQKADVLPLPLGKWNGRCFTIDLSNFGIEMFFSKQTLLKNRRACVAHQYWQYRKLAYTGRHCFIGYIRPARILRSGSKTLALVLGRMYPTHGGYIRCIKHIWCLYGFQKLGTSYRSDISDPKRTYPMYQTYLTSDQVLEPWHQFQVEYIWPKVDISNASDISGFWSGSRTLAAGSGRIYPTWLKSA
jgi:hypothetical protein